jgi:hypothetical protein
MGRMVSGYAGIPRNISFEEVDHSSPPLCLRHKGANQIRNLATPWWKDIQFANRTPESWLLRRHHDFHTSSPSSTSPAFCSPAIISAGASYFTEHSTFYLTIRHQFLVCLGGNGRFMDNLRESNAIMPSDW